MVSKYLSPEQNLQHDISYLEQLLCNCTVHSKDEILNKKQKPRGPPGSASEVNTPQPFTNRFKKPLNYFMTECVVMC